MGDTFSPNEVINNILHVLDALQDRLNDSDTPYKSLWEEAIKRQLLNLDNVITSMKVEE